eukprot:12856935-Heterocapsa_arctica.AAC.1
MEAISTSNTTEKYWPSSQAVAAPPGSFARDRPRGASELRSRPPAAVRPARRPYAPARCARPAGRALRSKA